MYIQLGTFALIWFALISFFGESAPDFRDYKMIFGKLPQAIAIYSVFYFIFTKWAWRLRIFQKWFVRVPDLEGTWKGNLISSWVNPKTNLGVDPIPATLVIRQDFYKTTCRLFTKESQSFSISADITQGPDGALCLSYTYTNKPGVLIRDRSAIHDGAAILQVIQQPKPILEGDYWTSRGTSGSMEFKFKSRKLEERFSE